MARRVSHGFTIIELLIVVMLIGVVVAIAIPNLLNAVDRGKQKRTMTNIRTIGTAVEAYAVDVSLYPTSVDINALAVSVGADYARGMPTVDSWNHALIYVADAGRGYTVGSGGKDGGSLTLVGSGGPTTAYNDAIVFSDGQFIQWPEGRQRY